MSIDFKRKTLMWMLESHIGCHVNSVKRKKICKGLPKQQQQQQQKTIS